MRVKELLDLLPGTVHHYQGDLDATFTGVTTGLPRRPPKGRFIVIRDDSWPAEIKGEDPDIPSSRRAERRIKTAFSRGATGVICSQRLQNSSVVEGRNVFFSADTYALVREIAANVRASLGHQRLTAVTGSAGKTTVKSMVVHALRACEAGRVMSTPGNKNMYRTVLSTLSQTGQYEHTVIEASSAALLAYRPHDFSISPDVGIITSIAEAHLDYVGTLENLIGVKSDIFQLPPPGGTAIINRDTLRAELLMERAVAEGCQLVTYGQSPEATIRLIDWDPESRRTVAMVGQERVEYIVGAESHHNAINSLAVIAALLAHRITNWRAGVESLDTFQAADGRGKTVEVNLSNGAGITLIDEAYNANPASIRSAVASLAVRSVPEGGRRVAVLGDIGELGTQAAELHRGLAGTLADAELDQVFLFGEHMQHLYQAARGKALNVQHWETLDDLRTDLLALLHDGDVVLMKASGTMGLQGLVKELTVANE